MNKLALVGTLLTLLAGTTALRAQEAPAFPTPQKEHQWLQQLAGEWTTEAEANFGPGQPPLKCSGTESVRSIGGFWVVSESKSTPMGMPMTGVMTLGFDPQKKKYIGTWIDSATNHLWKYEGTLDAAGKVLTLEADGPNLLEPGKTGKYRDAIELKSKDHKVLTSSMLGPDGKWVTFMTQNARRKK